MILGPAQTIYLALLLSLLVQNTFAASENGSVSQLLALSLEELLTVRIVSVASKRPEVITDVGGAVTQYHAKDIQRTGYYSLSDLATITPGYHSHTHQGETALGTRGFRGNEFENGKHLLLVDGIPFHDLRSNKVPVAYSMPLNIAEKVEFLRGPGSMLYGANAFYGVIDITPKTPKEDGPHFDFFARFGNPFAQQQTTLDAFNKSAYGDTTASVSYFERDASDYNLPNTFFPEAKLRDNQRSNFLFLNHKFATGSLEGVSAGLIRSARVTSRGDSLFFNDSENETDWTTLLLYLKYDKQWTDQLGMIMHIRYNNSEEKGAIIPSFEDNRSTDYKIDKEGYGAQAELNYDINNRANILLGVDYDTRKVLDFPHSYVYRIFSSSVPVLEADNPPFTSPIKLAGAYGQVQFAVNLMQETKFTLGGRYTSVRYGHENHEDFSPKITAVLELRDDLNFSLLYGESFRSPSSKEIGQNIIRTRNLSGFGVTPASLEPEVLKSIEAGLNYHRPKFTVDAKIFHAEINDPIERVSLDNARFLNSKNKIQSDGCELNIQYKHNRSLSFYSNYSYANTTSDNISSETEDSPTQTANLAVNIDNKIMGKPANLTMIHKWVKSYTSDPSKKEPDGFFITDLNFHSEIRKGLKLGVQVNNLFDESHLFPNDGEEILPLHERTIFGTLSYSY